MITECDVKNYTELTWKNKKEKSQAAGTLSAMRKLQWLFEKTTKNETMKFFFKKNIFFAFCIVFFTIFAKLLKLI